MMMRALEEDRPVILPNRTAAINATKADSGAWKGVSMMWVVEHQWPLILAFICAAFAVVLALSDIDKHRKHYERPRFQRTIIRLLFMLPFYGVLSWTSMWLPHARFVLLTIRDAYEAFALYQFMALMVAYAGGEGQLIYALEQKRYKGMHLFPCCCLPLYKLNRSFFLRCKRYILQYALIKPISAVMGLILAPMGLWRESEYAWTTNVYPWVLYINNTSISYALYYLVLFEQESERELAYCQAGIKFLCIKGIIFFAFWQSFCVGLMINNGLLYVGETDEEKEYVVGTLQMFLICVELAPIALTHHVAFSVTRLENELRDEPAYESGETLTEDQRKGAFDEAVNLEDMVQDTIKTIFYRKGALIADGSNKNELEEIEMEQKQEGGGGGGSGGGNGPVHHQYHHRSGLTQEEQEKLRMQEEYDILQDASQLYVDTDSDAEEAVDEKDWLDNVVVALPPMPKIFTDVFQIMAAGEISAPDGTQVKGSAGGIPIFCVVCGRNDRELVKRSSGYKCKECIGTKHQYLSAAALQAQQQRGSATAAVAAAGKLQKTSQLAPTTSAPRDGSVDPSHTAVQVDKPRP